MVLNINALTAAQLVALCRRATGSERAAVYAAVIGSARCESVTLSDGATDVSGPYEPLSATGRMLARDPAQHWLIREVYGWEGAL